MLSPTFTPSLAIFPDDSSRTIKAPHIEPANLQGARLSSIRTTLPFLSKKSASMGNFIKKVCIELHGLIRRPSSSERLDLFNNPRDLDLKSRAILTRTAMTRPVATFMAL